MVTIRDVARSAGVSIATVSRVINSSPRVSDDARRRVHRAASKLDYWPNGTARSLTTSRTHVLGVLLPDLFGEFFSEVIRGLDHTARDSKFQILVSSSHADTRDLIAAAQSMRGRIDGLIAMVPERGSAAAVRSLVRRFPTVVVNPPAAIDSCRAVSIGNYEGAHAMVQHLLGLGHTRIAMVKGPPGNVDAEERLRGYRAALKAAQIEPDPGLERPGDFTESSGYQATEALLRLDPRPTAIFAANDYTAVGVLGRLRDAALEVPRDMAVAGFDDIAISQYLTPALTTVQVDAYQLGVAAFRAFIAQLRSPAKRGARHEVLPTTLVVRQSCGSLRPSAPITRYRRQAPAEWSTAAAAPKRRPAARKGSGA